MTWHNWARNHAAVRHTRLFVARRRRSKFESRRLRAAAEPDATSHVARTVRQMARSRRRRGGGRRSAAHGCRHCAGSVSDLSVFLSGRVVRLSRACAHFARLSLRIVISRWSHVPNSTMSKRGELFVSEHHRKRFHVETSWTAASISSNALAANAPSAATRFRLGLPCSPFRRFWRRGHDRFRRSV